jgi:uncharacterized protein YkwD
MDGLAPFGEYRYSRFAASAAFPMGSRTMPRKLFAALLAGLIAATSAAAGGYRDYAQGVVAHLGATAKPRPDLEALLDGMVSGYRRAHGRAGLAASDLMRVAARAQAADIMALGESGHVSKRGDGFETRFEAFADPGVLYRVRGENAASDRRRGAADAAKARRLFQLWIDSGGHRRNMMQRDYAFVSSGVIQRGDQLWAVQIFWSAPEPNSPLFQQN